MLKYSRIISMRGTKMELTKCINERRSIRKYKEAEITKEEIEELIKAAQMAPSWKNSQTARFYVAHSQKYKEKMIDALPSFNKERAKDASCIIVSAIVKGISGYNAEGEAITHLGNGFECFDNGLAVENLCLKAYEMGYGTLIMGLYKENVIREIFEIPENIAIATVIAVGKADVCPDAPQRNEACEVLTIK